MKKHLILVLASLFFCVFSFAQTKDVVYLKNGSVIKGHVVEFVPNGNIKIQTADGSIFVYGASEVEKIKKEEPSPIESEGSVAVNKNTNDVVFEWEHHKMLIVKNGKVMSSYSYKKDKETMENFMGELESKRFRTGHIMEMSGICATAAGLVPFITSLFVRDSSTYLGLAIPGCILLASGVPLWICGHFKQVHSVLSCNERAANFPQISLYPSIQPMTNFCSTGKQDLSVGATLAFRF